MIAIRGYGSRIAWELVQLLPKHEEITVVPRDACPPTDSDRYLFCQGILLPKRMEDQTPEEMALSNKVNYEYIVETCNIILQHNSRARICVIGSESGYSGSFDGQYALSKMCLHRYVEEKRLRYPQQQLVCVAPSIIDDAAMTTRRLDIDNLLSIKERHPKKRFLRSIEVARFVKFLLYDDEGYTTGIVIRMNGGMHIK